MAVNKKQIDKLIYNEEYSWKPMVYEITSDLAYTYNVGFKDGETDCFSYFLYLTDNELDYPEWVDIYQLLLNKYIDTDYMRHLANGYFTDYSLKRYDLTKEEMKEIKKGMFDIRLNEKRNIRLKKESLLPYKGEKFKIRWNKWKMISRWKDYLKGPLIDIELGNGNFKIDMISKMSNNINEESVKELLVQQDIDYNDYAIIEVDNFLQTLPTVYCYKTEKDYIARRYVFDKVFVINTTKEGKLIPSKINCEIEYVHDLVLKELKCYNGDLSFVIEVWSCPRIDFVSIDFIPEKYKDLFIDKLIECLDPQVAFKSIKQDIIDNCVLYKEFDFATLKPCAPARLMLKDEYQEIMNTAKYYEFERFRKTKQLKAENINHNFVIKTVKFNDETDDYTITCKVDADFKRMLQDSPMLINWIEMSEECELKNNEIVLKIRSLSDWLPYYWWLMADAETKSFKYLKEYFFLNLTFIYWDKYKKVIVFPSFTTKYY